MTKINYCAKRLVERLAQSVAENYYRTRYDRYFQVKVRGLGLLPKSSAVIVPNHCTGVDGVALTTRLPRLSHFLVQKEGVYDTVLKQLLWLAGEIPVGVDKRSSKKRVFRRVMDYLKWSNDFVVIFSEGPAKGLIKYGQITPVDRREHYCGAALFAIAAGVPIVPVGLWVPGEANKQLWEPRREWKKSWGYLSDYLAKNGRGVPYYINIGELVFNWNKDSVAEERNYRRSMVRALTESTRRTICDLVGAAKENYLRDYPA